jgi:hypothetical protein
MTRMGCDCDKMGCSCSELGCGCDSLGCGCRDKSLLGQIEKATGMNPWWFLAGSVVGVSLWYVFQNSNSVLTPAGKESVMAPPPIAAPSAYANIAAVAQRLNDVETQYHMGHFTPEQVLTELDSLTTTAKTFTVYDSARVSQVLTDISSLRDKVNDFIQFRNSNPSIPQYVPPGSTPASMPVANIGSRLSAFR